MRERRRKRRGSVERALRVKPGGLETYSVLALLQSERKNAPQERMGFFELDWSVIFTQPHKVAILTKISSIEEFACCSR